MQVAFTSKFELIRRTSAETRTKEQLTEHYILEKQLAQELKLSSKEQRLFLYRDAYHRLFASLPHHPQHTARLKQDQYVDIQAAMLKAMVPRSAVFVEIGTGDGRLSVAMADHCASVVAIDVTADVLVENRPENFRFLRTDGTRIDLPDGAVDFVYSNQLMEHLHPDDAREQLSEIVRILVPGGRYLRITPNIHSGPHDISKFFDSEATGLHLQEYSYGSISRELASAGFRSVTPLLLRKGRAMPMSLRFAQGLEAGLAALDRLSGRALRWNPKVRSLLGIAVLARKAADA